MPHKLTDTHMHNILSAIVNIHMFTLLIALPLTFVNMHSRGGFAYQSRTGLFREMWFIDCWILHYLWLDVLGMTAQVCPPIYKSTRHPKRAMP